MAFTRIKYSKGRPYLYLVESYREGGKVKQRVLQYLGPVDINNQIQEIKSALQTSEFQEKEMQKRADWNQEGKGEMYKEEVDREQEEQKRLKKKLAVYERHQKKLGTTTKELGTTETKIKYHFDKINKETRAGNMVQIPKLWRKARKEGVSRKEFEKTLYKMEKERVIDLQVASATYVLKPEDKKLGMPHPTRGHINYIVWRKKEDKWSDKDKKALFELGKN